MRKSKFSESQIVAILKEGEAGLPMAEVCRKHSIRSPKAATIPSPCRAPCWTAHVI